MLEACAPNSRPSLTRRNAPPRSPGLDWTGIAPLLSSAKPRKDDAMGKEKNKGGKEARKPKKVVPKTIAANPSTKGAAPSK